MGMAGMHLFLCENRLRIEINSPFGARLPQQLHRQLQGKLYQTLKYKTTPASCQVPLRARAISVQHQWKLVEPQNNVAPPATTGNALYAVCPHVCRVPNVGHPFGRNFVITISGAHKHIPNGILGLLCKLHYPVCMEGVSAGIVVGPLHCRQ